MSQIESGSQIDASPPPAESPWRPVFVTLAIVGGTALRAIHLNDPASDGLPEREHPEAGLRWLLSYSDEFDIDIMLESGGDDRRIA